jgi:hypothetical protein
MAPPRNGCGFPPPGGRSNDRHRIRVDGPFEDLNGTDLHGGCARLPAVLPVKELAETATEVRDHTAPPETCVKREIQNKTITHDHQSLPPSAETYRSPNYGRSYSSTLTRLGSSTAPPPWTARLRQHKQRVGFSFARAP